jgi:hypothetical protein
MVLPLPERHVLANNKPGLVRVAFREGSRIDGINLR